MITFEQVSPEYIKVILDGKQVGHIFSPAGSGENVLNAIQVCGFEEAYDLWGCASFGELKDGITRMKKDIQLLFTEYDRREIKFNHGACVRCFSEPCICRTDILSEIFESQLPFAVKREQDLKGKIKYANEAIAEENSKLQGN